MRYLVLWAGQILLSVPWFLKWPFTIWNFVAHAHHIPYDESEVLLRWCLAGFGIIAMGAFAMLLEPGLMVFLKFLGPYIGAGLPAVRIGIQLSRKYRHLREIKLLEYKPAEHPQT